MFVVQLKYFLSDSVKEFWTTLYLFFVPTINKDGLVHGVKCDLTIINGEIQTDKTRSRQRCASGVTSSLMIVRSVKLRKRTYQNDSNRWAVPDEERIEWERWFHRLDRNRKCSTVVRKVDGKIKYCRCRWPCKTVSEHRDLRRFEINDCFRERRFDRELFQPENIFSRRNENLRSFDFCFRPTFILRSIELVFGANSTNDKGKFSETFFAQSEINAETKNKRKISSRRFSFGIGSTMFARISMWNKAKKRLITN